MKMKALLITIAVLSLLATLLSALGFNTFEWMTQVANQPQIWHFIYGSELLSMPFWYAYMLGGILPLWGGGFLAGIIIGMVMVWRRGKKEAKP
jgi:hypothetical protein